MKKKIPPTSKSFFAAAIGLFLTVNASAITIGFGPDLFGEQDTQSDGNNNQMRQNINITDTMFLAEGTYRATTWDYQAAEDSLTPGVTQPVFPFLTIVNDAANHTVLAFGATIDTEPGIQNMVPFGGETPTFVIGPGGATVAAGMQNPSAVGVQNSILTDTSFGVTDHANSLNFDEAGGVGNALTNFGHANLPRTYAFSIEVVVDDPNATPPEITNLRPANGATEVEAGSILLVTFDEPIVTGSGNITIKNLTDSTQDAIPVDDPQVSVSGAVLSIDPTAALEATKNYAIQIDPTAIEDTTGTNFAGISDDATWNFTTAAPDLTAPTITTLDPANGATNVAAGSLLVATFDEPIALGTGDITIKNLTDLTQTAIPVDDPQISLSAEILTIDPTTDFDLGKDFAIQIDATAIEDTAGNPFAGIDDDATWSFSTREPVIGEVTIGYGPDLSGTQDTQSDGSNNQMRQNINITDTVFLEAGTYEATTWDYNAGADSTVDGVTQPIFPFLTIVNGAANHTVLAFGATIDTEPGIQIMVPFGGENPIFDIEPGGATVAAGIQNPSEVGVQNSILQTGFGNTDHANSLSFSEAGGVGNTLDAFGHANLPRTYAFSINVSQGSQEELRITHIAYIDGESPSVEFTFNSSPNRSYTIQASTSLLPDGQPGGWTELDDGYGSEGDETTYTDDLSVVSGSRVYYRVRENPR